MKQEQSLEEFVNDLKRMALRRSALTRRATWLSISSMRPRRRRATPS